MTLFQPSYKNLVVPVYTTPVYIIVMLKEQCCREWFKTKLHYDKGDGELPNLSRMLKE